MHLINNIRPIEFFLEGKRSRTTKSVFPKLGLFQVALEPFLKSNLYDIVKIYYILINFFFFNYN